MPTRLDRALLSKMAKRLGKPKKYVRERISKKASRLAVASESAQVLWAKELNLGTSVALRKLPPHMQEQVRGALPTLFAGGEARTSAKPAKPTSGRAKRVDPLSLATDYLLADPDLNSRCRDLLKKSRHQDRALREATTVLEDRIKCLAGICGPINPEPLVNKAVNPDPAKAILIVSEQASVQAGYHSICRGIVLAFRHPAHHQLDDKVTREDALKICAFIDVMLAVLGQARVKQMPPS